MNGSRIEPAKNVVVQVPVPVDDSKSNKTIQWENLTCRISGSKFCLSPFSSPSSSSFFSCKGKKLRERKILKKLNGQVEESSLVGILGPSGSGKSTLLEILFRGQKRTLRSRHEITGSIKYNGVDKTNTRFISQSDYLYESLTVEESLVFASEVKGHPKDAILIMDILEHMWLTSCTKTRVANISGGQKKRLSIACELLSSPKFLFLDEPTSGLDSSTCWQCMQVLRGLVSEMGSTLSILLSIHQPSARVLSIFDQIYVLSKDGENMFAGPPDSLVPFLNSVGLECPKFHNPSDFMIEVASGEHGLDKLKQVVKKRNETLMTKVVLVPRKSFLTNRKSLSMVNGRSRESMADQSPLVKKSKVSSFKSLLVRNVKVVLREPLPTSLRFATHILVGLVVSLLYGQNVGVSNGCNFSNNYGQAQTVDSQEVVATNENMTLILFTLMFLTFTAMMPTLLVFSRELNIFLKEHSNGWYNISSYYLAITIVDLPFQIVLPTFFVIIVYPLTGQLMEWSRFLLFNLVCSITSLVANSVGMFIASAFTSSMNAVVFLAPVSGIPPFLFSGFFVRTNSIPELLRPIMYLSYIKYSFESLVLVIYGLDRCPSTQAYIEHDKVPKYVANFLFNHSDEFPLFKSSQYYGWKKVYFSYVLKEFNLEDGIDGETQLVFNIFMLLVFVLVLRIVTLLLLIRKARN